MVFSISSLTMQRGETQSVKKLTLWWLASWEKSTKMTQSKSCSCMVLVEIFPQVLTFWVVEPTWMTCQLIPSSREFNLWLTTRWLWLSLRDLCTSWFKAVAWGLSQLEFLTLTLRMSAKMPSSTHLSWPWVFVLRMLPHCLMWEYLGERRPLSFWWETKDSLLKKH